MDQAQKSPGHRAWWGDIVWQARASVLIFAISAAALILPAQVQDMLANLADFEDFSAESWWHALGFHGVMILTAFMLWFWARAVLLAHYRIADTLDARTTFRAMLRAPANATQQTERTAQAFDFVPRAMALGIAVVAVVATARSDKWLQAALAAGWGIGLYYLLKYRLVLQARLGLMQSGEKGTRPEGRLLPGRLWQRLLELLDYAPFGRSGAALVMAAASALFVMSTATAFESHSIEWKTYLAHLLPGPSVALFLLGMSVAPLSALTYCFDTTRLLYFRGRPIPLRWIPVLTVLLVLAGVAATEVNLHALRVIDGPARLMPDKRASLATLFRKWVEVCAPGNGPVQPIVVAVSGGASRAGMWAARVLDVVDDSVRRSGTKSASIFAVSSVSGGSLGAAAYESIRAGLSNVRGPKDLGHFRLPRAGEDIRTKAEREALRADAIGPALAGMMLGDGPRALAVYVFWPLDALYHLLVARDPSADQLAPYRGNDRAEALEGAFQNNWQSNAIETIGGGKSAPVPFDAPYLALFYRDDALTQPRGDVPLWVTNGTEVNTGDRLITVPFKINQEMFCTAKRSDAKAMAGKWYGVDPAASKADRQKALAACAPNMAYFWYAMGPFLSPYDALGLIKTDIPISTAVDNTSRFPFLSPSGELTPVKPALDGAQKDHDAEIIDGGYFENEGIVSAMEIADWLRSYGPGLIGGRKVFPIVVQATADADPGKLERDIPRCGNPRPKNPTVLETGSRSSQFLVPLIGLTAVRSGHSRAYLQAALQDFCDEGGQQAFFHFYLYDAPDFDVPLNWSLSEKVADFIWTDAMAMCGNQADRLNLVATLRLDPNAWKPDSERDRRAARDIYTCTDAPVKRTLSDLPMLGAD